MEDQDIDVVDAILNQSYEKIDDDIMIQQMGSNSVYIFWFMF